MWTYTRANTICTWILESHWQVFKMDFVLHIFKSPILGTEEHLIFNSAKAWQFQGTPPPHPKASWAALWLWYRTARGVEISHRQRMHLSRLLRGQMWEGSLWPPIIELLWLNPLGRGSCRCGCSSDFCKISMRLLVFALRNVRFTSASTEQLFCSLYLNSQACAQRPSTQWNYEEKEVPHGWRETERGHLALQRLPKTAFAFFTRDYRHSAPAAC